MQIICTSVQTDNHTSTSLLSCLWAGCSFCQTNGVKELKAISFEINCNCYNCFMALWILSGIIRVSRYQKGESNPVKEETVSGSGISWAMCKSEPCPRQITTAAPNHSVFTGPMPFMLPNKQRQSTEGISCEIK